MHSACSVHHSVLWIHNASSRVYFICDQPVLLVNWSNGLLKFHVAWSLNTWFILSYSCFLCYSERPKWLCVILLPSPAWYLLWFVLPCWFPAVVWRDREKPRKRSVRAVDVSAGILTNVLPNTSRQPSMSRHSNQVTSQYKSIERRRYTCLLESSPILHVFWIRGLSGKCTAILNILRTGRVALM